MKKLKKTLLITGLLAAFAPVVKGYELQIPEVNFKKSAIAASVVAGCSYIGYKLYKNVKIFKTIENKIVDRMTNALASFLVHNDKLTDKELKDKAWINNIRKRVILRLRAKDISMLSEQHQKAYTKSLARTRKFFSTLDFVYMPTKYDDNYVEPTALDVLIENKMVDSFVVSAKPEAECTQSELLKKQAAEKRSHEILIKITEKGLMKMVPQAYKSTFEKVLQSLLSFIPATK